MNECGFIEKTDNRQSLFYSLSHLIGRQRSNKILPIQRMREIEILENNGATKKKVDVAIIHPTEPGIFIYTILIDESIMRNQFKPHVDILAASRVNLRKTSLLNKFKSNLFGNTDESQKLEDALYLGNNLIASINLEHQAEVRNFESGEIVATVALPIPNKNSHYEVIFI